jgi:hypothetical protein
MISKPPSPPPPQRWQVQSLFNGRITASSGGRLAFSTRRSRFLSSRAPDTQWVR